MALKLTTGDQIWECDISSLGEDNASIAVYKGQIFVATQAHVVALQRRDGNYMWCTHLPSLQQYLPCLHLDPSKDSLIVAGGGHCSALRMMDGSPHAFSTTFTSDFKDTRIASLVTICSADRSGDPHGSPSPQVSAILSDIGQFGRRDVLLARRDNSDTFHT